MGRELVHDLATGKTEYFDFVPVNGPETFIGNGPEILEHKRFVTGPAHKRPRLSQFADLTDSLQLPERYRLSKLNTLTGQTWRDDVYKACYRHGDFSRHMVRAFTNICDKKNYTEALQSVDAANERLNRFGYSFSMDDDEITELAKAKSKTFNSILWRIDGTDDKFQRACELIGDLGICFSETTIQKAQDNGETFSLTNRVMDEQWLIRQLRKKCAYELEKIARDLALVEKHKQVYCSDFSVNRQRSRNKSNEQALENMVAYEDGNEDNWFTVSDLSSKSVSNPEIRRMEMFTRLRGFEETAQELGHEAVFFTVTAPSRFHSVSKSIVNQNWLAAGRPDAKQAHQYLLTIWQKLCRRLANYEIKMYGMRIAEPHQDGTPHHHLLMFMEAEHRDFVTTLYRELAMEDSPNEKGADKYRFKAEYIDPEKGSAVGYVAKYISKSIDGKHIDQDFNSKLDGASASERVVTWARINQIRQFQFVGGPSVSVWREMRRLREEFKEDDTVLSDLTEPEHFLLEKVRKAADVGDWKAFCFAMGGVFSKRKDQPVKLEYSVEEAARKLMETGEYSPTRYGDKAQGQVAGLMFKNVFLMTRYRKWKLTTKAQFIKAQEGVMENVVDWFDALEQEKEYERMCEQRFDEYEKRCQEIEEWDALMLCSSEIIASSSVGAAPPDWMH